jgi:hypothetical protein
MRGLNMIGSRQLASFAALVCLSAPALAFAQTTPDGWQVRRTPDGREIFTPRQGAQGETAIIYFPRERLDGRGLDTWLGSFLDRDVPPRGGQWQGAPTIKAEGGTAHAHRQYLDASGSRGFAVYMAISVDGASGRIARWTMSSEAVGQRHAATGQALFVELAALEKASARGGQADARSRPDARPPTAAPGRSGLRPGGPLQPGRYEGDLVMGKPVRHIVLLLHDNGEYEFLEGKGNSVDPYGKYKYQPASGKLDVSGVLYNSKYDPDEDFCLYGRDASGTPAIYAEDDYGIGVKKVWLRRVGDVDRAPHTVAAAKEKADRAEAARYKYVTAPGRGLRTSQIEAVYYAWDLVTRFDGQHIDESLLVLLSDGTVHDGTPVTPADLDVARSRREEPETWGRWRRRGGGYAFTWPKGSRHLTANGRVLRPARKGLRLSGQWSASSGSHVEGISTSWRTSGIKLGSDGRFEKFRSGGFSAGEGGTEGMSTTVYDDDGSATSSSTPTFAGGGRRKTANRGDRTGTYELDGYTITLRFDDGSVTRHAFAIDDDRRSIWLDDEMLDKPRR